MSQDVRIGVIGAGGIAQVSHLPAYDRIGEATVTALCDVDGGKAKRVADRFNVAHVYRSLEELVASDDVDAVDICLPNHLHEQAALAALAAGKHVLCEKPFTRSHAEASRVLAAGREADRVVMAGYNHRFRDDVRLLRRFVARGELGRVFFAKAGWLMRAATWTGEGWRKERATAGGGVLWDLGAQVLDVGLWLLGMPAVATVSATAHPAPEGDRLETTAAALIRLEDGGTLGLEVGWGLHLEKDLAYLNLFGDTGAAQLHPLTLHKQMHGSLVNVTPARERPRNTYQQSYENELRHFVARVADGGRPDAPADHAVEVLGVLEALVRSAREGKEVPVR